MAYFPSLKKLAGEVYLKYSKAVEGSYDAPLYLVKSGVLPEEAEACLMPVDGEYYEQSFVPRILIMVEYIIRIDVEEVAEKIYHMFPAFHQRLLRINAYGPTEAGYGDWPIMASALREIFHEAYWYGHNEWGNLFSRNPRPERGTCCLACNEYYAKLQVIFLEWHKLLWDFEAKFTRKYGISPERIVSSVYTKQYVKEAIPRYDYYGLKRSKKEPYPAVCDRLIRPWDVYHRKWIRKRDIHHLKYAEWRIDSLAWDRYTKRKTV